ALGPEEEEADISEEAAAAVLEEVPEEDVFTLEDLTSPESTIPVTEPAPIEELSFEDLEIELPELEEVETIEELATIVEEAPATETPAEAPAEEPLAEISFEGLEELFKEEK
ncbi:MAG: hypothetical protein Q4B18_04670, partial [Bacillota bacterium]|nr:hypothetical protein [Bacillota bacterium]